MEILSVIEAINKHHDDDYKASSADDYGSSPKPTSSPALYLSNIVLGVVGFVGIVSIASYVASLELKQAAEIDYDSMV